MKLIYDFVPMKSEIGSMYLKRFKLRNFRGYKEAVEINFDDLTAFVGKMIVENQLYWKH